MRAFTGVVALVALVLFAAGCRNTTSGSCTHCPDFKSLNSSACGDYWKDKHCKSYGTKEVTDTNCAVGQAPTTHLVCAWDDCDSVEPKFDCDQFASF